jgi:tetratricopeptide (TPR) repeat protein
MRTLHTAWLAAAAGIGTIAWLAWMCFCDPRIIFFFDRRPAHWIVFPSARSPDAHYNAPLDTVFRRAFLVTNPPPGAELKIRAAVRFTVAINGSPVAVPAGRNWKQYSSAEVASCLRPGTNVVEVQVDYDRGPPALWLSLTMGEITLNSDSTWEASCAGSAWRPAALASASRAPGPGNPVAGGEGLYSSLTTVWPRWIAFGVIAVAIWAMRRWWFEPAALPATPIESRLDRREVMFLLVPALLWVVLFSHNTPLLPPVIGFDSSDHVDYIRYIQKRHTLPLANEGAEMFQPPLYYGISALILSGLGRSSIDPVAGFALRGLGAALSIVQLVLVFLSLRLLFTGKAGPPRIGTILAAFIPMQLYLAQFVTNEILAATLATATLYLCLRWLKMENPSMSQSVALGICLGAACLAKMTNVLLIPVVMVALAMRLARRRQSLKTWFNTAGIAGATCLAVCGWFYVRNWIHFGSPLVGNWDAISGFAWWQDSGYHTVADYARFGRSIVHPIFSSFNGFADGLYATLWGDGLCGGTINLDSRPPWNYNLMASGYLLAMVPTLIILCGGVVGLVRFLREPAPDRLVVLGFLGFVAFGILTMSLKVPSYAQAKAFYGLGAMVPFCYCGGVGWEFLTRKSKLLEFLFGGALLVWAMNSFASVWISGAAASPHIYQALWLAGKNNTAAGEELLAAVKQEPTNAAAIRLLAVTLDQFGNVEEALTHAQRAVELNPMDPLPHLVLGRVSAGLGQNERAIDELHRALTLGPECLPAYQDLTIGLLEKGDDARSIELARQGLAVSPDDALLHDAAGLAMIRSGQNATGTNQLTYTLSFCPDWEPGVQLDWGLVLIQSGNVAEGLSRLRKSVRLAPSPVALNELARVLATHPDASVRNGSEALQLARQACSLAGENNATLLSTLAAAYAEAGMFPLAVETVQKAIVLAQSSGDNELLARDREMLASFQANQPFHQKPGERRSLPGLIQYRFR